MMIDDTATVGGPSPEPDPGAGERMRLSRRSVLALGVAVPTVGLLTRSFAGAAPATPAGGPAGIAPRAVVAGSTQFVSVSPSRIADTRPGSQTGYASFGFARIDANTIRVRVAGQGGMPAGASAAVLNITMTNPSGAGFVVAYPAGTARPAEASNINVENGGQTLANLVTVKLSALGEIDLFCYRPADLVVDVAGAYVPVVAAVSAGRFVGFDSSIRTLDTRDSPGRTKMFARETRRIPLAGVPTTASAAVVNLTVTESNGAGFVTAFVPGTSLPTASNVNADAAGQTRANLAILPINGLAAIDVFNYAGGHLVIDVLGYFTGAADSAGTDGLFVPTAPDRRLDTRKLAYYGRMYAGWVCEFDFVGRAGAQAVVFNLTTSETRKDGFFTAFAARTDRPVPASNLNASYADQTIANMAITRTSTAGVSVYTQNGGDVIVDVAGYFVGVPVPAKYVAVVNVIPPPPAPGPLPYSLTIPKLGMSVGVYEGIGSNIVDAGAVGHWPGTGLAGENGHQVLFGHRTTHGGIFRDLHLLGPGDDLYLRAADGRLFHYGYWSRALTNSDATNIFGAGLSTPRPSLSLVACTQLNYLPTNVNYRIVVNFTQIA